MTEVRMWIPEELMLIERPGNPGKMIAGDPLEILKFIFRLAIEVREKIDYNSLIGQMQTNPDLGIDLPMMLSNIGIIISEIKEKVLDLRVG